MPKRLLWIPVGIALLVGLFVVLASSAGEDEPTDSPDVRVEQASAAAIDHAAIIRGWDAEALERGRAIYADNCAACHGADGQASANPLAAAFTRDTLKNGSDPYGLWRTLTAGYELMPAQSWLTPEQRYDVVHYLREAFFKEHNPSQYAAVTEAYLDSLSGLPEAERAAGQRLPMDYGPALTYELGATRSALVLPLSDRLTLYYDLHTMSVPAVWTGGFVDLSGSHHLEYKGRERGRIAGQALGLGPLQWAYRGRFDDPREGAEQLGPMPAEAVAYRGHYLFGDRTVLSYAVEGRDVLDLPEDASGADVIAVAHTLRIGAGSRLLVVSLGQLGASESAYRLRLDGERADASGPAPHHLLLAGGDAPVALGVAGTTGGLEWDTDREGRLLLKIPPDVRPRLIKIYRATSDDAEHVADYVRRRVASAHPTDPALYTRGGPRRWKGDVATSGTLGDTLGEVGGAYALDRLALPDGNPWHSWMRLTDLAFFEDGRCAVSTLNGDVWVVSGIDEGLDKLTWRRFATGLYEPLGLAIKGGEVYVLGRDRITRLRDRNRDGEADVYENFHPLSHVSNGYHAFTFGLHTDDEGNFYTVQSGRKTDNPLPGAVLRIAPDGQTSEVVGTGFRHPNGMTVGPEGRIFVSDNQGEWIPASKVSHIREGGFYGYVLEEDSLEAPETFDRPVFWLPQEADNSSGGQAWATDGRWGPLAGTMVHTSYGAARAFYVMVQDARGTLQAAVAAFPWAFPSGVMRAAVNPKDGQVYLIGLKGWDSVAQEDASFNRIRYTGRPAYLVTDAAVTPEGLRLRFSAPLKADVATDPSRYAVTRWDYKWTSQYGSPHYLPPDPGEEPTQEGEETVSIADVRLEEDGRAVLIPIPDHQPVDQVEVAFDLEAADGTPIEQTLYFTINRIPDRQNASTLTKRER